MKQWQTWLIVAGVLAVIGGAGYWGAQSGQVTASDPPQAPITVSVTRGDVQLTITAPGLLVNTSEALLGFEASGQLAEILVRPGDYVKAGQAVARLNARPLEDKLETARLELAQAKAEQARELSQARLDLQIAEAELSQQKMNLSSLAVAESALMAAQAELAELLAGPDENEVTVAAAELRQAEIALKQAQWAYDEVAHRTDVGARPEAAKLEEATLTYEAKVAGYNLAIQAATPAEIANARAKVQQAQAAYDEAGAEQGVNGQQLAILKAKVEKAQLTVEALRAGVDPALVRAVKVAEADLKAATLAAPFDGVILEVQAKPGETVNDRAGVILIAQTAALEVSTKVIEEDLPLVQVGQPVEVFFDAVPEAVVRGRVARIVPQRIKGEDRPLYPVYLSLDALPEHVMAGMTADASIIIAQKSKVLRLPRALVQANSEGIGVVEVWANQQLQRREVQVGLRGDVYVEIMAGLNEGDEVVGQ